MKSYWLFFAALFANTMALGTSGLLTAAAATPGRTWATS